MLTVAMGRHGGIQAMSGGGNGFGDEGRPELSQIFNFLALAAEGVLVPLKKMQKTNVGAAMIKYELSFSDFAIIIIIYN